MESGSDDELSTKVHHADALMMASVYFLSSMVAALQAPNSMMHARVPASRASSIVALSQGVAAGAKPAPARSRIKAYLGNDQAAQSILWTKTDGGLSYKDVEEGDGDNLLEAGSVVSIAYTASYLGTSTPFETVTSARPLSFVIDDSPRFAVFQEAVAGMKVGGFRRLLLPPSAKYAMQSATGTVEFDLKVVEVKTGADATLFKIGGWRSLFRLALLAFAAPDLLELAGVTGGGSAPLPEAGVAELAVQVAQQHPVVVDAANRWAADGLAGLM